MENGTIQQPVVMAVPTPGPKRPWFRYSLRTLLIFVLLIGSGMGLWWKWEPWKLTHQVETGGTQCAAFSPDGELVVLSLRNAVVAELATGRIITHLSYDPGDYLDNPRWSSDGRWLSFKTALERCPLGDTQSWTEYPVASWDATSGSYRPTERGAELGYGTIVPLPGNSGDKWVVARTTARDGRTLQEVPGPAVNLYSKQNYSTKTETDLLADLRAPIQGEFGVYFGGTISEDGNWIIVCSDRHQFAFVWHRRRPEYWWGLAWLPEFWLTAVFAVAFVWSVRRDRCDDRRGAGPSSA
ncbi:MAG: hypothetical protein ABSE73_01795 [Planctomycetota bacterium]